MNATGITTSAHQARALSAIALLSSCAALAVGALVLLANAGYVVLGFFAVGAALVASWTALTRRGSQRGVAVAVVVVAVGLLVLAVVGASSDGVQVIVRLIILAALLSLAIWSSRAAIRRTIAQTSAGRFRHVAVPSRPVLLCNPWSGGGKVEKFQILELATSMGIETVVLDHGLDLATLARDAIDRGADCLGMAGGDGSQALVASIAIAHGLPFVCVSAGTRNHFALDLGFDIGDPRHCLDAFRDGIERRIDYATVNGRLFVNNVSLGIYATIVQQEGYRESKVATSTDLLPSLLGDADRPFDLQFTSPDGADIDGAFLVQVSNNPYVLGASLDASQRRRIDTGVLGVFAVSAASGPDAAAAVTAVLTGRADKSRHVEQFTASSFQVRSRSGSAFAGVDGEALELSTPLDFEIHPSGLRLLVPKDNADQAIRREAREVKFGDLFSVLMHGTLSRNEYTSPDPAQAGHEGQR